MSVISTNQIYIGTKKGSTWGTEVQITSTGAVGMYASSLSMSAAYDDFLPRDVGQGVKRSSQARLAENVTFTTTHDVTYGQGWLVPLAAFLGTESAPSETTVSQADYTDNMDLADDTYGNFWSLAWTIESDRVLAVPSAKPVGFTYTHDVNGAGSISFQWIGDTLVESSTTTAGNLSGLTAYTYETATLGGTNHYFRINTASGSGLTSGENMTVTGWTLSMSRPHQTRFGLRGANTKYTLEPKQLGPIDGTLQVRFSELDNATYDMWTHWYGAANYKAEIFYDGSQIGSGVNRSYKWQFPKLQATGAMPSGHDFANNNSLLLPSLTYRLLKASAAPTGMSGVTDLLRVVPIWQTKTSKWSS